MPRGVLGQYWEAPFSVLGDTFLHSGQILGARWGHLRAQVLKTTQKTAHAGLALGSHW